MHSGNPAGVGRSHKRAGWSCGEPSPPVPPFDCVIVLSTRAYDPTGFAGLQLFGWKRRARYFFRAQMDISVKCNCLNPKAQLRAQVPDIAMDKMVGKLVALMNQRI